ncbi:hypothetical protein [Urechidicola croceus]|uniref:Uncharacterized protein n=1 Tax=Urechidicola croceus TaxID=1850246 RepID=A0A1D8PC28_9FLAO|nr:hypothetical protein [Urechidicola croceus]AOW22055.1 hypothetical protein LPB138_08370 [Urechidicola croceus]
MKDLNSVLAAISKLTGEIETNHPELYQFLDENPITIPSVDHPNTKLKIMNDYLNSLKELLRHHLETHKNK